MPETLAPGATIGILGGGQLGRMLALAAARLALRAHIFDPAADGPAAQVSARATTAAWDDAGALADFAASVDVVTYEFENVPAGTLDAIGDLAPVRPGRRALAVSQDRLEEKAYLAGIGLPVATFAAVDGPDDLAAAMDKTGLPAILKTRRFGYDGKGQARIAHPGEAEAALATLNGAPAILEAVISFERELSVIAARGIDGRVAAFDPGENVHRDGILRTTTVPGDIRGSAARDAVLMAGRLLTELDYVGVLGLELFEAGNALIVNEFAPRVHNSGHWTQNGCVIDQFEQHIRAVAGWPIGDGSRHSDVVMENLIGRDIERVPALAAEDAALHLYGKGEVRDGRKLGHVNRITGPKG